MQRFLVRDTCEVSVDGEARDPRELVSGEDEWPRIAVLSRHARVDKDVLQLACAMAAKRTHPKSGPPTPVSPMEPRAQVCHLPGIPTVDCPHLQPSPSS